MKRRQFLHQQCNFHSLLPLFIHSLHGSSSEVSSQRQLAFPTLWETLPQNPSSGTKDGTSQAGNTCGAALIEGVLRQQDTNSTSCLPREKHLLKNPNMNCRTHTVFNKLMVLSSTENLPGSSPGLM